MRDHEPTRCIDCGAPLCGGLDCKAHFHQFLCWEAEVPSLLAVHHLMVLCYHLQHPRLYSPAALEHAIGMLDAFVREGLPPAEMRRRLASRADSNRRTWKITGTPEAFGRYDRPIPWTLFAGDVARGGLAAYFASIHAWSRSMHDALCKGGLLTAPRSPSNGRHR